jgi:hypothetical protein
MVGMVVEAMEVRISRLLELPMVVGSRGEVAGDSVLAVVVRLVAEARQRGGESRRPVGG